MTLGSTTRITSPPRPPLPPSGPPSGLNFSRWIEAQPCPPSPAVTCSTTRSTKVPSVDLQAAVLRTDARRAVPRTGCRPPRRCMRSRVRRTRRPSGTMLTTRRPRRVPNSTVPADEREQRVVVATADTGAGVEVGAALANDDLAGVDELTTEALDAEALGVGVAAVAGRTGALLVCHRVSPTLVLDAGDAYLGRACCGAPSACGSRSCSCTSGCRSWGPWPPRQDLDGHGHLGERGRRRR